MQKIRRFLVMLLLMVTMAVSVSITAYADDVGDIGDTDQGDITGSNIYTFYYYYDSSLDAITLTVQALRPINSFGHTTSHTFRSSYDSTVLNTANPRLGRSLDSAISDMINYGGYNMSVSNVKNKLGVLGYYDKGNGVWKISGGYLTYISAVRIRPQRHTVHYNANGGLSLQVSITLQQVR